MSSALLRPLQFVLIFTGVLLASAWLQEDENTDFDLNHSPYNAYLALDLADEHDSEDSIPLPQLSSSPNSSNAKSLATPIPKLNVKPAYQCIRAPPVTA